MYFKYGDRSLLLQNSLGKNLHQPCGPASLFFITAYPNIAIFSGFSMTFIQHSMLSFATYNLTTSTHSRRIFVIPQTQFFQIYFYQNVCRGICQNAFVIVDSLLKYNVLYAGSLLSCLFLQYYYCQPLQNPLQVYLPHLCLIPKT